VVAIKVMWKDHFQHEEDMAEMIRKEIAIHSQLSSSTAHHPNIFAYYGYFEDNERCKW